MAVTAFPADFLQGLDMLPGVGDREAFLRALEAPSPVSIRFNPYKLSEKPEGESVPWSRYGFYLDQRPQFTLDPLFHAGAYYVQEASSMFVEAIYGSVFSERERGLRVLDLCAAPGGKTTLLSTMAGAENLVVANEPIRQRALVLADNVQKWGVGNVAVTNNDPSHFAAFRHWFDMLLVDAPCSGEGMFRKNPDARGEWSRAGVELCAARGKRIISDAWDSLKPGGVLVLSTCTYNTEENEGTVKWIAENFEVEPVDIATGPGWGVVAGEVEGIATFRFYPHLVKGEGLFAAVMRKKDGRVKSITPRGRKKIFGELSGPDRKSAAMWVNQPGYMDFTGIGNNVYGYYKEVSADIRNLAESLNVIYSGVLAGQLYHGKLKPEHSLALFHDLNREMAAETGLDLDQARDYLRKTDLPAEPFAEGLNLVTYEGFPLGWIKRIAARTNNMYPKELRIMNL